RHDYLPPETGGPRLPVQAFIAPRRPGPTRRHSTRNNRCTVPARNRAIHDLAIPAGHACQRGPEPVLPAAMCGPGLPTVEREIPAERVADPRTEPLLPPVVVRGAADRLPRRDSLRAGGGSRQAGIGGVRPPRRRRRTLPL